MLNVLLRHHNFWGSLKHHGPHRNPPLRSPCVQTGFLAGNAFRLTAVYPVSSNIDSGRCQANIIKHLTETVWNSVPDRSIAMESFVYSWSCTKDPNFQLGFSLLIYSLIPNTTDDSFGSIRKGNIVVMSRHNCQSKCRSRENASWIREKDNLRLMGQTEDREGKTGCTFLKTGSV